MADNVILNAGAGGSTLATDDIAGVHYQLAKMVWGPLDTANLVDNAAGKRLPVDGSSVTQPISGTVTANAGSGTLAVSAVSLPLPTGAATEATLDARTGILTETAPATDTASSGLNGRLQRVAQRITTLIGSTLAISAASLPLPAGAATEATLDARTGIPTETAPATDTASSGLNGRLQRVAQRLTSLIGLLPAALVGGRLDVNVGASGVTLADNLTQLAGTAVDVNSGIKSAGTLRVVLATDQPQLTNKLLVTPDSVALPANQSVNVAQINAVTPLMGNGVTGTGSPRVTVASDNTPFTVKANLEPETSGGLTMTKLISAATTNATSVKASAGQVYNIQVFNLNAAARFLKLYNKASAPTVGTDVPVKTIMIPGNTAGSGAVMDFPNGLAFGTGIAFALTTVMTDADATAVAANEIIVNIDYK